MAPVVPPGQKAAATALKNRRGELDLTQREVAELAGVHVRTVQDFERGLTWPHSTTLAQLERLALEWPVGRFQQIYDDAHKEQNRHQKDEPPADPLIVAVFHSNMGLEEKLQVIEKLRATADEPIRSAVEHEERRLAELLGEEPKKSRGVA